MSPEMYFLDVKQHDMDEGLSKQKGHVYRYLLNHTQRNNILVQEMTVTRAA